MIAKRIVLSLIIALGLSVPEAIAQSGAYQQYLFCNEHDSPGQFSFTNTVDIWNLSISGARIEPNPQELKILPYYEAPRYSAVLGDTITVKFESNLSEGAGVLSTGHDNFGDTIDDYHDHKFADIPAILSGPKNKSPVDKNGQFKSSYTNTTFTGVWWYRYWMYCHHEDPVSGQFYRGPLRELDNPNKNIGMYIDWVPRLDVLQQQGAGDWTAIKRDDTPTHRTFYVTLGSDIKLTASRTPQRAGYRNFTTVVKDKNGNQIESISTKSDVSITLEYTVTPDIFPLTVEMAEQFGDAVWQSWWGSYDMVGTYAIVAQEDLVEPSITLSGPSVKQLDGSYFADFKSQVYVSLSCEALGANAEIDFAIIDGTGTPFPLEFSKAKCDTNLALPSLLSANNSPYTVSVAAVENAYIVVDVASIQPAKLTFINNIVPSSVLLTAEPAIVVRGDTIRLDAIVSPTTATGNVIFLIDDEQVGDPVAINPETRVATMHWSPTEHSEKHIVAAHYLGDDAHSEAWSETLEITVLMRPSDLFESSEEDIRRIIGADLLARIASEMQNRRTMLVDARRRLVGENPRVRRGEGGACSSESGDTAFTTALRGYKQAANCNSESLLESQKLLENPLKMYGSVEVSSSNGWIDARFSGKSSIGGDEIQRRLIYSNFGLRQLRDGVLTGVANATLAFEKSFGSSSLGGIYLGMDASLSDVRRTFSGRIKTLGLAAGAYGVTNLDNGLTLAGYTQFGLAHQDLWLKNEVLTVDGNYWSQQFFAAVQLTGVIEMQHMLLRPNLSAHFGSARVGTAHFDALAWGLSDPVSLYVGRVNASELDMGIHFDIPLGKTLRNESYAAMATLSPQFKCQRLKVPGYDTKQHCGLSGGVNWRQNLPNGLVIEAGAQNHNNKNLAYLNLTYTRDF